MNTILPGMWAWVIWPIAKGAGLALLTVAGIALLTYLSLGIGRLLELIF